MPAITITSVNTGTEEITATAHGLLTGDRFRLRNVGGALPAATPALAAVTDYFAITTGANTFKVSDTNAHALAGTNIVNLTGSGTGTNTVEYGLPYSNPTVLPAIGGQISSPNIAASWNALVAIYDLLTHQPQSVFATEVIPVPRCAPGFTGSAADQAALVPAGTSAPSGRHMPIGGLAIGRTITAVRARVVDEGPTNTLIVLLTKYDPGATGGAPTSSTTDVASTSSAASSGGGLVETIQTTGIAVTVEAGVTYNVTVRKSNGASATCRVLDCEIDAL